MKMGFEIVFGGVQAGDAERNNYKKSSESKYKPIDGGRFDGTGAAGAVKYYCGKSEQCERDEDWGNNRACPDGRY